MKKLILITVLAALMTVPAIAEPTLDFSKDAIPGGWSYDTATKIFTFPQPIGIDSSYFNPGDLLETAYVYLPDMIVGGSAGAWTLTPTIASGGTITIETKSDGTGTVLITGTLGSGDLIPSGNTATAYTPSLVDIVWTSWDGNVTLGSPTLAALWNNGVADMNLGFAGGPDTFQQMIDGTKTGTFADGLTGAMTIPEPGAILLGGIGVCLVGWLRRRGTL